MQVISEQHWQSLLIEIARLDRGRGEAIGRTTEAASAPSGRTLPSRATMARPSPPEKTAGRAQIGAVGAADTGSSRRCRLRILLGIFSTPNSNKSWRSISSSADEPHLPDPLAPRRKYRRFTRMHLLWLIFRIKMSCPSIRYML